MDTKTERSLAETGREAQRDSLREAGIEPRSQVTRITYNRPAQIMVAHFYSEGPPEGIPVGSIYYRHKGQSRYRRVPSSGQRRTYEAPVTAALAPVLLANVKEWAADGTAGVSWRGIWRIDLDSGKVSNPFCENDLALEHAYTMGWVESLHEAWANGGGVVCTIGFVRPANDAEKEKWRATTGTELITKVDHWLCDLNLESKTYERLTPLAATHF